jgi:hypothetical protein
MASLAVVGAVLGLAGALAQGGSAHAAVEVASAAHGVDAQPALQEPAGIPPLPPSGEGCYRYADGGWQRVTCLTSAYVRKHLRHLELEDGIQTATLSLTGTGQGYAGAPFLLSELQLNFLHVGSEHDSVLGPNTFSLQDNTTFVGNNGDSDGVQFADQSRPSGPDAVCVWNVDITTQNYATGTSCVPAPLAPRLHGPTIQTGDEPQVFGEVLPGDRLETVAFLPWTGAMWSVVAPDEYGLGEGRWTNISGSVLGYQDGSKATFSSAEVQTSIVGSSCEQWTVTATGCVGPKLNPLAEPFYSGATEETNNLVPVIGEPPTHLPSVTYFGGWARDYEAFVRYVSTTTGRCPGTTPSQVCQ